MLRTWAPFQRNYDSFQPIRTVGSVVGSKSVTYTKVPQETENLLKMVSGAPFGNIRSLHVKRLSSNKLVVLSDETQPISETLNVRLGDKKSKFEPY